MFFICEETKTNVAQWLGLHRYFGCVFSHFGGDIFSGLQVRGQEIWTIDCDCLENDSSERFNVARSAIGGFTLNTAIADHPCSFTCSVVLQ